MEILMASLLQPSLPTFITGNNDLHFRVLLKGVIKLSLEILQYRTKSLGRLKQNVTYCMGAYKMKQKISTIYYYLEPT